MTPMTQEKFLIFLTHKGFDFTSDTPHSRVCPWSNGLPICEANFEYYMYQYSQNRTQDSDNQKSVDPEELADQYAILHVTIFTNRMQDGLSSEKQNLQVQRKWLANSQRVEQAERADYSFGFLALSLPSHGMLGVAGSVGKAWSTGAAAPPTGLSLADEDPGPDSMSRS